MKMQATVMESAINQLSIAVMMLDEMGRVCNMNDAATSLVRNRGGLKVRNNRPYAVHVSSNQCLQESIHQGSQGKSRNFIIQNEFDGTISQALIFPVSQSQSDWWGNDVSLILMVKEHSDRYPGHTDILIALYRLTPMESRLAEALCRGLSLQQFAELEKIKHETVRTHLKNLFSKTYTRRQAELVALLMRSLPSW